MKKIAFGLALVLAVSTLNISACEIGHSTGPDMGLTHRPPPPPPHHGHRPPPPKPPAPPPPTSSTGGSST